MIDDSSAYIHRADCCFREEETAHCTGCELSAAYESIRVLLAQRNNPQRDDEDRKEWDRAVSLAHAVLPETKYIRQST